MCAVGLPTLGAALASRQESAAALRAQPACSECPPAKVDLVMYH